MPKRRDEFREERIFQALANWTETKPGREVLVADHVREPGNWQVWSAFHESRYVEDPPRLSHAVTRLREVSRDRVTHVYEWWVPGGLATPKELTVIFYAHEIEPILRNRGVKNGLASVKEIYALRVADEQDAGFLEMSVDDKLMEVLREYYDAEGNLVLVLRQLLGVDEVTGTERSLKGISMEGRLEW